jgi:dihydrofolate reductase
MRRLTYYVGMTIDGRIAGPDGGIDFFPLGEVMGWISENYPETLPVPVREQIGLDAEPKHFDTILMGRATYQPALDLGVTAIYAPLRHYIVSSTLGPVDDDLVTVVPGNALALVRRLKAEDGGELYLAGGGTLAGSLLSEIDRMVVKLYPVVANAGVPAFTGEFSPTAFTLRGTETLADGVTILTYDRT